MRCTKSAFATRAKADAALQIIRKRGDRRDSKPTRSYQCQWCGKWHLTSRPQ